MTFLNPLVLIALAAASIPLLLHLLNRSRLRTIEFSSLRFLKELQKTRIRRIKLNNILLLLLRIGLVVFAVLAFARPALQSSVGLPGSHAATTAVILIDDSFSMALRDERGERFAQATKAALDVVGLFEDNDEAYVVSMTDLERSPESEPSRNPDALRRRIESLRIGYRRADLDDALNVAASLLDKSTNINKEVYLITDAQRTNVVGAVDSLEIFDAPTRIYLMTIGDDESAQANLALDSIRVLSAVFEREKPVEVRAWVHNYSQHPFENSVVSMFVGGQRLAQKTVSVPPDRTVAVDIAAAPKATGMAGGYVEIAGDALSLDNRQYFAIRVPDRVRIAVVGSPESQRFLSLVFGLPGSAIELERFGASGIAALDLMRYTTVIVADVPSISAGDAEKLSLYMQQGGGVVIYAGPSLDRNGFNTQAGVRLGLGLGAPVGNAVNREKPLRFGSVEREHPIFLGVFDPSNPGNTVESPDIYQALPTTGGETIIRLTNGAAFMSELRHGRGRLVYIAAPPTGAWSNLPLKGIFVPLAVRSALYVGASGEAFAQTIVGDDVSVPLPARADLPDQVKVIPPSGRDEFVPTRRFPSGASIGFGNTHAPGVYRVNANGVDVAMFTANMGSGESDLTKMTEEQLRAVVEAKTPNKSNVVTLRERGDGYGDVISESRYGLELWKYMLALALLCAFAEMIVGRGARTVVEAHA
ncbi:MAG: BatA domain-containing protein [bacterium]|nr:BatA domain-containing protein [Candidatus Kapabacteria bacterium]